MSKISRWVSLNRERAFTLLELRRLNRRVESEGRRLRARGARLPLDGYTSRLGGTEAEPGLSGLWLETYIDRAIEERVIDPEDIAA
jgi:hypothetical protein